MNKTTLKNFATNARKELIEKVKARAFIIGVTEENIKKAQFESSDAIYIDGKQLSATEKKQREKVISQIKEIGYNQVVEEVAYTWFNRFTALRFMEVNNYLPSKVRVLSSSNSDGSEPDIIKEALTVDLDIDKELVYELKVNNKNEELFKYLVIKQCNSLNNVLPFMFETIDDYKEILFPDGLLAKDSFLREMTNVTAIPESDWEQVEIIGWLYQFYISDEKDRVYKEKKKFKAEEIPLATQLFTPDWIVRYMVQNSLGRYWVESHPDHYDMTNQWEFYLNDQERKTDCFEKKVPIINKGLNVEDIKCFDPAMGSGHVLVYMFEIIYSIYSKCGYMESEIPRLIIENNLYGLDIDERAYQLACFSVVMKALEYNKRFLKSIERNKLKINLFAIKETNILNEEDITYISGADNGEVFFKTKQFFNQFRNAKSIGSLIKLNNLDTEYLEERLRYIEATPISNIFEIEKRERVLALLPDFLKQSEIMGQQYDILVTNPPYMGSALMNSDLYDYLKANYPDSKLDVYAAFMDLFHYLKPNAYYACVNQHSWMFIASFEGLRRKVVRNMFIQSMLHLGPRAFEEISGEVVQTTTFVMKNTICPSNKGTYINLTHERSANGKRIKAIEVIKDGNDINYFLFNQKKALQIPGNPLAYWLNDNYFKLFENNSIDEYVEAKAGVVTGNDVYFVKLWHEINYQEITMGVVESNGEYGKYHLLSKGGSHRRYYGNNEYVIKLNDLWNPAKTNVSVRRGDKDYYFKKAIGWSYVGNSQKSFRIVENSVCGTATPTVYLKDDDSFHYFLAFLNSKVSFSLLNIFNQTMNLLSSDICSLPMIINKNYYEIVNGLTLDLISISKMDWDSFEVSWDFKQHNMLLQPFKSDLIEDTYNNWSGFLTKQIFKFKSNQEELNRIFIEIYGLEKELSSAIDDNDNTIREADVERDIKSFISYAIGCLFGRYSLDEEGLIFAGGEFKYERYQSFTVDEDNILPILSESYFEDDIISRFIEFVNVVFGEDNLTENLNYLAEILGNKKGETAKETIKRYILNDFFNDHVQAYKKRPIYWLFTSGKQKAFNCLIYMHRYDKSTLSRIRTDYLHELQIRMDAEKKIFLDTINGDGTAKEIANAKKELKSLDLKIEELKAYDEKLHHMADMQIEIDLDDGVAVNYAKFEGLLAPIK